MKQFEKLCLDGKFWGPWIRKVFVSDIELMKRSTFDYILPSFPNPDIEANKVMNESYKEMMSNVYEIEDNTILNLAIEKGLGEYQGLVKIRQAAANLSATMLWHLFEQQILLFHSRQVLTIKEEVDVRNDSKERNKLLNVDEFHKRLDKSGCSMKSLPSWSKVNELNYVANAIKHGPGKSLDKLCEIRNDLLIYPTEDINYSFKREPSWVKKPAGGEDIYIGDVDLAVYFDAVINLWQEFSYAIEKHSINL